MGVDEWAWRKGQRYGTILVDLERHAPIDLLEDATAESFAAWLEKHPTIEVVSRDRGTTFADGANRGAPQALQIADRWHSINTMGEALEKVLAWHHADLKRVMAPAPAEDQLLLLLLQRAHPQVRTACELAQTFVQMIRARKASALEPWLKEAIESEVPELRTFATGIKRDQDAIHAALTYE